MACKNLSGRVQYFPFIYFWNVQSAILALCGPDIKNVVKLSSYTYLFMTTSVDLMSPLEPVSESCPSSPLIPRRARYRPDAADHWHASRIQRKSRATARLYRNPCPPIGLFSIKRCKQRHPHAAASDHGPECYYNTRHITVPVIVYTRCS